MQFQRLLHQQDDVVIVPGLGDVAVNFALVDGGDGGADIGIAGEQDAHGIGPFLPHLFEELRAVHVGHAHVGDHQIDRLLLEQRQALRTALGGMNLVAMRPEQAAQGAENVRFVIHEQQGGGGRLVGSSSDRHVAHDDFFHLFHRQADTEGRAHARRAFHLDRAVMFLHDAVGQRQSQPGALAHRLGGEERVENAGEVLGLQCLCRYRQFPPTRSSPSCPVRMVMVPRFSMAWPALTSRFMNTWLSWEGMHSISGRLPYSLTTSALYLSSFHTMLSVLSRPWCRSHHLPFGFIHMGKVLEILHDFLHPRNAFPGLRQQGGNVFLEEVQVELFPCTP